MAAARSFMARRRASFKSEEPEPNAGTHESGCPFAVFGFFRVRFSSPKARMLAKRFDGIPLGLDAGKVGVVFATALPSDGDDKDADADTVG